MEQCKLCATSQACKDCEGESQQGAAVQASDKACSESAHMGCDFKTWGQQNLYTYLTKSLMQMLMLIFWMTSLCNSSQPNSLMRMWDMSYVNNLCKQWLPTHMCTYPSISPTYSIGSELSLYEQTANLLHSLALFVV